MPEEGCRCLDEILFMLAEIDALYGFGANIFCIPSRSAARPMAAP